jgi:hypothetical protein
MQRCTYLTDQCLRHTRKCLQPAAPISIVHRFQTCTDFKRHGCRKQEESRRAQAGEEPLPADGRKRAGIDLAALVRESNAGVQKRAATDPVPEVCVRACQCM